MKTPLRTLSLSAVRPLLLVSLALAPPAYAVRPQEPAPASPPTQEPQAEADRIAQREAAFAALLTNVELRGSTTISGEEGLKEDRYTLKSVKKEADGKWRFEAIVHFGKRPVPLAVSLPVEWAGDTPVITVTQLAVPFMGTYDARVLFHGDQYVGLWNGKGYGGHIFGQVVPIEEAPPGEAAPPAPGDGKEARAVPSWPQYRGPSAQGLGGDAPLPTTFDVTTGENVLWRVPVPGLAHSSPVVWGDRIFLTTAIRDAGEAELRVGLYGDVGSVQDDSRHRFEVHCLDRATGKTLWTKVAWQGVPAIKRHPKGSHAASTPACDAERVVVFFGSEGLHCFDHAGNLLWQRDFGVLDSGFFMDESAQWGFASSPVLHDGKVIVQCDVQNDSFLAVLDARTGETIWRVAREEEPGWSTPTVHVDADRAQIVCNGWKHMGAYALADGKELWRVVPGGDIPVPTPVTADGLVYLTNAHGRFAPILAISLDAEGMISLAPEQREHLAWGMAKGGNYMQTPLVTGGLAFFCRDNGVISCFDARTGEQRFIERLDEGRSGYTSSPVHGDGKLYYTSEEGTVVTVAARPTFEVLGRSSLGEEHMATPAIVEGVLYFRSRAHLTAVGLHRPEPR